MWVVVLDGIWQQASLTMRLFVPGYCDLPGGGGGGVTCQAGASKAQPYQIALWEI